MMMSKLPPCDASGAQACLFESAPPSTFLECEAACQAVSALPPNPWSSDLSIPDDGGDSELVVIIQKSKAKTTNYP